MVDRPQLRKCLYKDDRAGQVDPKTNELMKTNLNAVYIWHTCRRMQDSLTKIDTFHLCHFTGPASCAEHAFTTCMVGSLHSVLCCCLLFNNPPNQKLFVKMLFSHNPIRSAATAAFIVSVAHYGTKFLSSLHAFHLAQAIIATVAIGALLALIILHHRMEGQMLNQSQEEIAVIGFLALLWVVFLVGWKSFANSTSTGAGTEGVAIPSRDPCLQDGVYCVYEEYYHW